MATTTDTQSITDRYQEGPLNVVKTFKLWLILSFFLIVPGIVFMGMSVKEYSTHSPLRLGIDFTGGTMAQYGFSDTLSQDDILTMRGALEENGITGAIIQLQQAREGLKGQAATLSTTIPDEGNPSTEGSAPPAAESKSITAFFEAEAEKETVSESKDIAIKSIVSIRTKELSQESTFALRTMLKKNYGDFVILQKNTIGPTLAKELFVKAAWALVLAFAVIVIYLTFRFQLDYAVIAIVALFHDALFTLGAFSMLGWFLNVEVDSMFVTAILTVIGFSVHDTIVVFDRVRENMKLLYTKKVPFVDIVNISVNQTLTRSINTSVTTLVTLGTLYFFGGESTQNFILAMMLGIIIGTYSSIFIASPLLGWWRLRQEQKAGTGSTKPQAA